MRSSKSSKSTSTNKKNKFRHGNLIHKHMCRSAYVLDYSFDGIPSLVIVCDICSKINVIRSPLPNVFYSFN